MSTYLKLEGGRGPQCRDTAFIFQRPPDTEIKNTVVQTILVKRNKFCKTWRKIKGPQESQTEATCKENPRQQLPPTPVSTESWVWNRSEYSGAGVPWARGGNRGSQSWLRALSWSCWAPAATVSWRSTGIPLPFHLLYRHPVPSAMLGPRLWAIWQHSCAPRTAEQMCLKAQFSLFTVCPSAFSPCQNQQIGKPV